MSQIPGNRAGVRSNFGGVMMPIWHQLVTCQYFMILNGIDLQTCWQ